MNNIPGWTSDRDLKILSTLASFVPENGNILEIGSFLGRSTKSLYLGKQPSVNLSIIDTFKISRPYIPSYLKTQLMDGSRDIFNKACDIATQVGSWLPAFEFCIGDQIFSDLQINECSSEEFVIDKEYDLVFLDGNHSHESVFLEITKYSGKNNLIVGDDFSWRYPGVATAILESNKTSNRKTIISPYKSKIWILVPNEGYWNTIFRENNLIFFD